MTSPGPNHLRARLIGAEAHLMEWPADGSVEGFL
jgi:hypothetical protein